MYLETLKNGFHKMMVMFKNSNDVKKTISHASPRTGDTSAVAGWMGLFAMASAALAWGLKKYRLK